MHKMRMKEKYYNLLKSGEKTIEARLLDDKRKAIKTGDIITFYNVSYENESFQAKVTALHKAGSFEELCDIINPQDVGFDSKASLLKAQEEFYTPEREKKFGVVGIEIAKIGYKIGQKLCISKKI